MPDIKEFTNRELGIILEEIQKDVKHVTKYIEGNGKKGLLDRMNDAENCLDKVSGDVKELVKLRQTAYSKIFDVIWKVGTVALFTLLGIDKLK